MEIQKKHVSMVTDIVKDLVCSGIDALAERYIPTETKKKKTRKRRARKNRKTIDETNNNAS